MPKVLNKYKATAAELAAGIYVGRGSRWGNPFKIGIHGDRNSVCDRFESDILPQLDVSALRGKDLICFCAPQRCHADALLKKANGPSDMAQKPVYAPENEYDTAMPGPARAMVGLTGQKPSEPYQGSERHIAKHSAMNREAKDN